MALYKQFTENVKGKKLILFGAGAFGAQTLILNLKDYNVAYFCDNDPQKWGTLFMGIPVHSPEILLKEDRNNIIVLITSSYTNAIKEQLERKFGISCITLDVITAPPHTNFVEQCESLTRRYNVLSQSNKMEYILSLLADVRSKEILETILHNYETGNMYFGSIYEKQQYFNDVFEDSMCEDEVYVDGGVWNGDTILWFIQYANNKYARIYGFEPDPLNYWITVNKFSNASEKIKLYNSALSDHEGQAWFSTLLGQDSKIDKDGGYLATLIKLDDVVNEKVTFIKLDVEGGEYDALMGAKNIIQAFKPKLAISLYHKDDDLWKLPLLVHELVPEYKLYIRHHTLDSGETVLYAKI